MDLDLFGADYALILLADFQEKKKLWTKNSFVDIFVIGYFDLSIFPPNMNPAKKRDIYRQLDRWIHMDR